MRTSIRASLFALCTFFVACGPDYPACENDDDCHEGEFCVNDLCQQCRDDSDCPAGQSCNDGRCDPIQGWCAGNGDCGPGEECQNNRCVASSTEDLPPQSTGPTNNGPCSLDTVYFAFDSDELDSSTRDALTSIARCIQTRGIARVHVTGYTDPRGTEEYNLALGDRRARAVMQYLTSLGLGRDSLSASSMGEEMAQGEDEGGWRNDRKVTFTER
ncbi:MAG: OmpA family protein [Myxococcales bacterium]|nr:OmpA family protein [Myxococcales bacterium]